MSPRKRPQDSENGPVCSQAFQPRGSFQAIDPTKNGAGSAGDTEEALHADLPGQLECQQAETWLQNRLTPLRQLSEDVSGGAAAMYLREIRHHKLLTAEEEIWLAQQLEVGRDAQHELASADVSLDPAQRAELEQRAQDGHAARRLLIESNLRVVASLARQYVNRGLSFLDLVQEGNIGLQIGIDKYDWRYGFRLSTYVYWWIRQAMARALLEQSRMIRLPVHVSELFVHAVRVEREIRASTGAVPTIEAIAEKLGAERDRVAEAYRAAQTLVSIDAHVSAHSELALGDLISDDVAAEAAQRDLEQKELSQCVANALQNLDPSERTILQMHFGLVHGEQWSRAEIAEMIGITTERVRQIEQSALAKLRHMPGLRAEMQALLAA